MDLHISSAPAQGPVVVAATGDLDIHTVPKLRAVIDEVIARGRVQIVLDLSDLSFIDSSGVGAIIGCYKALLAHDGWLRLVVTKERILRVFELTGVEKIMVIRDTADEAVAAQ